MTEKEKREFTLFQREFTKYQKLFGLTGYKIYFKFEPIDDCFANITVTQNNMVATVRLSSSLHGGEKPHRNVRQSAKHEAIHLLLFRLEYRAHSRFISENEIIEAVEEMVFKLEGLIK